MINFKIFIKNYKYLVNYITNMPFLYNCLPSSDNGVIQNGLVLNLDSSLTGSYPKTGTTWTDLVATRQYSLLANSGSVTYSALNEGTLNFSNPNTTNRQYATSTLNLGTLSTFSINLWFRNNGGPNSIYAAYFTNIFNATTPSDINFSVQYNGDTTYVKGGFYRVSTGTWYTTSNTFIPTTNVWYNVCFTYDGTTSANGLKFYVDGVLNSTGTAALTPGNSGLGYYVAKRWDNNINTDYVNAIIPVVNVYNRELSAQEVRYNYDTLKYRYT